MTDYIDAHVRGLEALKSEPLSKLLEDLKAKIQRDPIDDPRIKHESGGYGAAMSSYFPELPHQQIFNELERRVQQMAMSLEDLRLIALSLEDMVNFSRVFGANYVRRMVNLSLLVGRRLGVAELEKVTKADTQADETKAGIAAVVGGEALATGAETTSGDAGVGEGTEGETNYKDWVSVKSNPKL